MTAALQEQLRRIPKAELHLHLEGSLRPETLWALSRSQGAPWGLADLAACRRLYQFTDFAGFIQAIKTASRLLQSPPDYAAAVRDLARQLQSQGVVYSEVFLSIGILLWRQVAVEPYWEAIAEATRAAESETGVRIRWLFDAVRQFGVAPFEQVLEWALQLQSSGLVIGIGIGGDEAAGPAAWFAAGYARARAAGLHTTAHAGETCGPESVWAAIDLLGAERVGHGLRAYQDPRLVEALAKRRIPLDICPTSNRRTGVWAADQPHPASRYYNSGVMLSISTDDPGIFACTLLGEYTSLAAEGAFPAPDLQRLAAKSFECSFLTPSERRAFAALPLLPAPDAGRDRGMGVE